ncbi:ATP-dependent DNA helicase RecG [Candidatus Dojkabacteria bacterium]|nr:ATP-dependent DNA helicase RecG [Candidatus Dojkabacteria bacterium]
MSEKKVTANDNVQYLPRVGPKVAILLSKLGIERVEDLLNHFPTRYVDTSQILRVHQLLVEKEGTVLLKITNVKRVFTRTKGMSIVTATGTDGENFISIRWFNQPYILSAIKPGNDYLFSGKLTVKTNEFYLSNPIHEEIKENSLESTVHLGRITPVYPETKGLSSRKFRTIFTKIKPLVKELVTETLSTELLTKESLIPRSEAIFKIHFPESETDIEKARERIGFEELYEIQLKLKKIKTIQKKRKAIPITPKKGLPLLIKTFPHELTKAQKRSIEEIIVDTSGKAPMHRLLAGDVGCGKTIVALTALVSAIDNKLTGIIMAPTTILAAQHYETIKSYLPPKYTNSIKLITAQTRKIKIENKPQILIGTQALLHHKDLPKKIGVVVIDEQHRFGVRQRGKLAFVDKTGNNPHYLIMTATPIPRTLALSLYGSLDISYIDEMPKGRIPVKTHFTNNTEKVYEWIREKILNGKETEDYEQLFVICPLIEESPHLQSKAAMLEFDRLKNKIFPEFDIALLHGRQKEQEKQKILSDFAKLRYDILVATPVVEVGIDIPHASIMIIESAERFGLAQLHQLRGRIGRRNQKSHCFLFSESDSTDVKERLEYFAKTIDGLKVAEYDLKRRGPGEVYGTLQSGIPRIKIASLLDQSLMKRTHDAVFGE